MDHAAVIGSDRLPFGQNGIVYFRKRFVAEAGQPFQLKLYADARCKLYLNRRFLYAGPAKGNDRERYHDQLDLSPHIKTGENELVIRVLQLSPLDNPTSFPYIASLFRSGMAALQIDGRLGDEPFVTDSTWECAVEEGVHFFPPKDTGYTGLPEDFSQKKHRLTWSSVVVFRYPSGNFTYGEPSPWYSVASPVPPPRLKEKRLIIKDPALLDAGYLTCAYLSLTFTGRGCVKLTYGERLRIDGNPDRTASGGDVRGDYDIVSVDGTTVFEPFWFRTFRYIKIEAKGTAHLCEAVAYETGYPIDIRNDYDFGVEEDNALWDISVRTLKRCMHDTFTDCPYYEQLQYAMDTYLQCLFAYQISGDDRLQKRVIRDFSLSANAEGLTASRSPSVKKQFIPCFSLYYILMVLAYVNRSGDTAMLLDNMPTITGIFSWYRRHSNSDRLVLKSEFWHFIDWAESFSVGVPQGEDGATLGIESLMLCYVLKKTAEALKNTAYQSLSDAYISWSQDIRCASQKQYYCPSNGLYANTENKRYFSQHMQLWAVLTECVSGKEAKALLTRSLTLDEGVQGNFSYAYLLFRALEKADMYDERRAMLEKFRKLLTFHCTTIPETYQDKRSECHAWGAVVLYEFTVLDLGVRKEGDTVILSPYTKDRPYAKGTVYTGLGPIYVHWKKEGDTVVLYNRAPDGVSVKVRPRSGDTLVLSETEPA